MVGKTYKVKHKSHGEFEGRVVSFDEWEDWALLEITKGIVESGSGYVYAFTGDSMSFDLTLCDLEEVPS